MQRAKTNSAEEGMCCDTGSGGVPAGFVGAGRDVEGVCEGGGRESGFPGKEPEGGEVEV